MAESKLEENEVETKKAARKSTKKIKQEGINDEKIKKVGEKKETNSKTKKDSSAKPTTTKKTTSKKKPTTKKTTATKKTNTTSKKETMPKVTKRNNKKSATITKNEEGPKVEKNSEIKSSKGKELIAKKEITLDEEKLEKIKKEINKQTKMPEEQKKKINKKIFQNIAIAIGIIIYFIFINLGFHNIEENTYLTDLNVFSAVTIGITIILFEKAYKKDSGEVAIYGIEMLILSVSTLLTNYIYKIHNYKFVYIITSIAMLFAIYYVGKSIVIYVKMKNKALKKASDIHKIVRK